MSATPMTQHKTISRRDAVILASRLMAVILTVYALVALSGLPETLYGFRHYASEVEPTVRSEYLRHLYLITLGFQITRIIGYSLMASWLFRCGPDMEELLLPAHLREESSE